MSIEELLQLKIKKISKLLTISEDYNEDIVITQLNNCLFDKLKTNLKEGTFLEKSQLLKDLQRWSYELNLYLDNPFLIGKTIIGIINENKDQSYNFYRNILNISEEESVILKENQGIPSLIISDYKIKKYIIKNKYRKEEVIDLEDIEFINNLYVEDKIDVRQFLSHIMIFTQCEYEDIIFIDFPSSYIRENMGNKIMKQICDFIVINTNDIQQYQSELQELTSLDYRKLVMINTGNYNEFLKVFNQVVCRNKNFKININPFSVDKIKQKLSSLNRKQIYISFKEELLIKLLKIEKFYLEDIQKTKQLLMQFNKDIIISDSDKLALETLRNMRNSIKENHLKSKELLKRHQLLRNEIIEIFYKIEQIFDIRLQKVGLEKNTYHIQDYQKNLWLDLSILLIELNELSLVEIYIDRLNKIGDERIVILNLAYLEQQGKPYKQEYLDRLNLMNNDDDFIIHTKIKYRKEIGLSDEEAGELCLKLDRVEYADELYLKATKLVKSNFKEAIKLLQSSFERGFTKAGEYLFRLYNNSNTDNINLDIGYFSNNMLPEAVLEVARNYMSLNNVIPAIIHYKLAIGLGSYEALVELADIRYQQNDYSGSLPLYEVLVDGLTENYIEFCERLGVCYYKTQKYQSALHIFKKAKTAISHFYLGYMYENELGTLPNLKLALYHYYESYNLGYKDAQKSYQDLKIKLDKKMMKTWKNK